MSKPNCESPSDESVYVFVCTFCVLFGGSTPKIIAVSLCDDSHKKLNEKNSVAQSSVSSSVHLIIICYGAYGWSV